jgi:hypothetical protein
VGVSVGQLASWSCENCQFGFQLVKIKLEWGLIFWPEWINSHQCTSWPFCPLDGLRFFIRRRMGFITVDFFLLLTTVFLFFFLARFALDLTSHIATLLTFLPCSLFYLATVLNTYPTNLATVLTTYPTNLATVLSTYPTNLATVLITYPTNLATLRTYHLPY